MLPSTHTDVMRRPVLVLEVSDEEERAVRNDDEKLRRRSEIREGRKELP